MSTIRVRRGLEADRLSFTPAVGEPIFTTDTKKLYVGDGSTPGGILVDMNPAIVPDLVQSVAGRTGDVVLVKSDVGLSSVDNTADANKPVSVATQAALDAKATVAALTAHASNTANPHSTTKAQVGLSDVDNVSAAALRDRSTHTGTQATSTVAGLDAALAGKQPAGTYPTMVELINGLATKADASHSHVQGDVTGLIAALATKQAVLVSGTTIKTINGNSLLGSGDIVISGGGGGTTNQAEIDFGASGDTDKMFNIADAGISPSSKITACVAWASTLGRDADEIMADPISLSIEPKTGSMDVYAMALDGSVSGKYAINYQIG